MAHNESSSHYGDNHRSNLVSAGGKQKFRNGMVNGNEGGIQLQFIQENKYYLSPSSSEVDLPSDHLGEDGSDGGRNLRGSSEKFSSGNGAAFLGTHRNETPQRENQDQYRNLVVLAPHDTYVPRHPYINFKPSIEKLNIQAHKSIAAVSWPDWNIRIYFQDSFRHIQEFCPMDRDKRDRNIAPTHIGIEDAKLDTPLAVISRFGGSEIRLYYISNQNTIREWCFFEGNGWSSGSLNNEQISVSSYSNLAAVASPSSIHIYYQSTDSNIYECSTLDIKPSWKSDKTPVTALMGSALAAAALLGSEGLEVHLYYQRGNLQVNEYIWDGIGWEEGFFPPSPAQKYTTLSVMSWTSPSEQIRVYLRSGKSEDSKDVMQLVELRWEDDEWDTISLHVPAVAYIPENAQLAVLQQRILSRSSLKTFFVGVDGKVVELE